MVLIHWIGLGSCICAKRKYRKESGRSIASGGLEEVKDRKTI